MEVTTVQELIDALQKIEDKTLAIRLVNSLEDDEENIWIHSIEVSDTGQSGYELDGEVRLLGSE